MKRFLLSLAILVMACGLSFGQNVPQTGTGTGATGLSLVETIGIAWQSPLHQIEAFEGFEDLPSLPVAGVPYSGYPYDHLVHFPHFTARVRQNYNDIAGNWTGEMPKEDIYIFGFPGMVPQNNPEAMLTYKATHYIRLKNMHDAKLPEDQTVLDNHVLQGYTLRTRQHPHQYTPDFGKAAIFQTVTTKQQQLRDQLVAANTRVVDGVTYVPRVKAYWIPQRTKDSPTSITYADGFHKSILAGGVVQMQAHYIFILDYPTHIPSDNLLDGSLPE